MPAATATKRKRVPAKAATAERESAKFLRETIEVKPSGFELARAIAAYIPILEASYAFAQGNPNPKMPAGYQIVAPIRMKMEEALESAESVSPEAAAAVENDLKAVGFGAEEGTEGIPNPEAFGFVVREIATKALIVSIRGTQTPKEWLANFTAVPNPFSEVPGFGLVHLGFERMWRSIRDDVNNALKNEPAVNRITFLGHSLGGAMATLGTVDIKKNLKRPTVDLCTFGCPRAGKVRFRINFNKLIERCFRVTETRDIVPHVPSVITAWNHVGKQIEVRSKQENPHSLVSYLEGLKGIGLAAEEGVSGAGQLVEARTL